MSDIIEIRGTDKKLSPEHEELLIRDQANAKLLEEREESATLLVALMQARFSRPAPEEMLEILWCAMKQVVALNAPSQ